MSQEARHSARAAPALTALAEADPALAALSLWCRHRDGARTVATGDLITYGADFEALERHEQIGLAAHHILHVALRHPARLAELEARLGETFDPLLYNLAADALINETLLMSDYALPRPAVRLSEVLTRALGKEIEPAQALAEWDVERLYFALNTGGEGEGRAREAAEGYAAEQSFENDLEPQPGESDDDGRTQEAARWRQHVTRAMDAGRLAGRGIGRNLHRLADVAPPRLPWEVLLRRLLSRAVTRQPQADPRRPSRRWMASTAFAQQQGAPEPGFAPGTKPLLDIPRIAVGLDASSSIDTARLALFWAEVTGIARRMRAELHLMVFDDAIRHRARLDPAQTRFGLPDLPRGGGTAFVPVIAEAQRMEASALVMLTDLEGDAGPPPRAMPVLWVVPEPGALVPPFGRLIDMTA